MHFDVQHHYALWEKEQESVLISLKGKEVWVLFSGGKDSSLALYLLHEASKKFGFSFKAHAGSYPKHRYTPSEMARTDGFWEEKGVQILWHNVDISDDFLETAENPCAVCQRERKRLLYNVVAEGVTDLSKLVLVTAYTLSDLVSYSLEYLLGATYSDGDPKRVRVSRQRFVETGQRFYPVLKMEGGLTIYRPILTYNSKNVIQIVERAGVPVLSVPCQYAHFRPKRILETYYESMSLHFDYYRLLEFACASLELPHIDEYVSMSKEHFLKRVF
jgi:tRNA(Ile)-lysidine synthase TilS/MesJ